MFRCSVIDFHISFKDFLYSGYSKTSIIIAHIVSKIKDMSLKNSLNFFTIIPP